MFPNQIFLASGSWFPGSMWTGFRRSRSPLKFCTYVLMCVFLWVGPSLSTGFQSIFNTHRKRIRPTLPLSLGCVFWMVVAATVLGLVVPYKRITALEGTKFCLKEVTLCWKRALFWQSRRQYSKSLSLKEVSGRKSYLCDVRTRRHLRHYLMPSHSLYIKGSDGPERLSGLPKNAQLVRD